MPRNMVSGKSSNQSAQGVDIPPTTRILVFPVTRFDVWEYVLPGNQEYGRVVALQAYVLHIGSTSRNERQTVASEQSLDVPSV
jgi:hypothetical protein